MPVSSIRGLEAGDEAFPLRADAVEQALEARVARAAAGAAGRRGPASGS